MKPATSTLSAPKWELYEISYRIAQEQEAVKPPVMIKMSCTLMGGDP